jgi:hypothetical protein
MADHARLSPSASSIWMNCPGQPTLAVGITDSGSSKYATLGTLAHSVLERCIRGGFEAIRDVGISRDGQTFLTEDAEAVQVALDWIRGEFDNKSDDEAETEVRLRYNDDYWGTADFVRYRPSTGELLVVDYKHGSGVAVEAKDNPQGVGYALMKVKSLGNRGISRVRFVIIQPRCFHEDGPIREFVVDGIDMLEWEDRIVDAIDMVQHASFDAGPEASTDLPSWNDEYLRPGSHCRWCKAAAICPKLAKQTTDALQADFSAIEPGGYDVAKLAESLSRIDQVKAWVKAVDEFAYAEAERGVTIPGFKLVKKRPTRVVKNEQGIIETVELLGVDSGVIMTPPAIKSPAQLEIALEPFMDGKTKKARTEAAKQLLSEHIDAVSGGHALVPESDPRPPLRGDVTDDFSAVE